MCGGGWIGFGFAIVAVWPGELRCHVRLEVVFRIIVWIHNNTAHNKCK